MSIFSKLCFAAFCLLISTLALADLSIPVYFVTGVEAGQLAGNILVSETQYGLLFTPKLQHLKPGVHGFHVHQFSDCTDQGMAAGGHLDPKNTNKHLGPYNADGHLGDLPAIYVDADGKANLPVLAPRLTHVDQLQSHSLMLHEGGDNYADTPAKLGGGGTRMICGIIK